eukprot:3906603-Rhodomonas_salina.2
MSLASTLLLRLVQHSTEKLDSPGSKRDGTTTTYLSHWYCCSTTAPPLVQPTATPVQTTTTWYGCA